MSKKLFTINFDKIIKSPYVGVISNKNNLIYSFNIPAKNKVYFKKNIVPFFNVLLSNLSKTKVYDAFPNTYKNYLDKLLKTTSSYSPEFMKKLTTEISVFTPSQIELFLEYNNFNYFFARKSNPLMDVLRIKNGIITKKVVSNQIETACRATYPGFIRTLVEGTPKFVTINIDGTKKDLLVKSFAGNNNSTSVVGINTLALDPVTLDVYGIKKNPTSKPSFLKEFEYTRLYENPNPGKYDFSKKMFIENTPKQKKLRYLISKYSAENQAKNIASFKADVKKMVSDPATLKIIKERYIKKEPTISKLKKIKNVFSKIKKK